VPSTLLAIRTVKSVLKSAPKFKYTADRVRATAATLPVTISNRLRDAISFAAPPADFGA